jgi:adenylate cyclase
VRLFDARREEASRLADELLVLLDSIGDPNLTIALSMGAATVKHEIADMAAVLRVTQRIIDFADSDLRKGDELFGSPATLAHALRGAARMCMGITGWRDDLHKAAREARAFDPLTQQAVNFYSFVLAIPYGVLLPDATVLRQTAEILAMAEQSADDMVLFGAQTARGITLIHQGADAREEGFQLLATIRERAMTGRYSLNVLPIADIHIAAEKTRLGDLDGAIALSRAVLDGLYDSGVSVWSGLATAVLVEALLARGADKDLDFARAAIDQLAAVPTVPGFVLYEITMLRLRTLLARALGKEADYCEIRDRYRTMANDLGFEGHMAIAATM